MGFYNVIIVGAGPAGTTLAYELARKGIKVLLLEKERLPRYKVCAGGVSVKAANLLGFDISSVVEATIYGVRITYQVGNIGTRLYHQPLAYAVMRDKFDYLLTQKAKEAGATVLDGREVTQIRWHSEGVSVQTSRKTFTARIVVGADGAYSVVAESAGLMRNATLSTALQAEIPVSPDKLVNWDSIVEIDVGHLQGVYGWVFPKRDHLSIGVTRVNQAKKLAPYYEQLLASLNLNGSKLPQPKSHLIPFRKMGMPIQQGKVLLLGDAAGLASPLTGEGIYYAIKSAKLAAPVILRYLEGDASDLQDYGRVVDEQLMPNLNIARKMARFVAAVPRLALDLVRQDIVWEIACCLLRGEKTYVGIEEELKGFSVFNHVFQQGEVRE